MFTLVGLTKTLPDKSKDILKNINLSFYPGAKIGVVGLNGSGKVRLFFVLLEMNHILCTYFEYLLNFLYCWLQIACCCCFTDSNNFNCWLVNTPQNYGRH